MGRVGLEPFFFDLRLAPTAEFVASPRSDMSGGLLSNEGVCAGKNKGKYVYVSRKYQLNQLGSNPLGDAIWQFFNI